MDVAIDPRKQVEILLREAQEGFDRDDLDHAAAKLQAVTKLDPDHPDALYGLGRIAYLRGQNPLALRLIGEALKRRDHFPTALNTLGGVLMKMKEWDAAFDTLKGALRQQPRNVSALSNLGAVCVEKDDLEQAEKYLRRAIQLQPTHAIAWNNLGNVQVRRDHWDAARAHYEKALALRPDYPDALRSLGNVLTKMGKLERATQCLQHALDLEPLGVDALTGLASAKKFAPDDPDLPRFRRAAGDANNWSREQRVGFFFAWGKALDDSKHYDDAFLCFDNGNRLKAEECQYNAPGFSKFVDQLAEAFPRERIEELQEWGARDDAPVFILGMPRSGTTLTEQILASHPEVHGGGELTAMRETLNDVFGGDVENRYSQWWREADGASVRAVGEGYLRRLPRAKGALRVTDKMPGNFLHLGLIRLALPNARIIHCVRNPMDVCLSCFQKNFKQGQYFSYRQDWTGQRFRDYARLMEFWRKLFPGQWLDVSYEAMVEDSESWARRIVDHAGLTWDDACIEFHTTKRVVHTASVWQVRQPVYKSAVARWRRYESHLEPMREALGEYIDWHERFLSGATSANS